MIDGTSLHFAPLVPLWLLAAVALAVLAVGGFALARRARGAPLRLVMLLLGVLVLANPLIVREQRETLDDQALVVVDRSPSQKIAGRTETTERALEHIRRELDGLAGVETVELEVEGDGRGGTRLFGAIADRLAELDRSRIGGVLVLSDGQVHDPVEDLEELGLAAPLHVLLTGQRDEYDRRLSVEEVPDYAIVGDEHSITLRVEEQPEGRGEPVAVTLRQDGEVTANLALRPGQTRTVPFQVERAGRTVLEVVAEEAEGELTALNNRQVFFVNGVRDRLRVLLVSGQPYPGLRVWRNLLKADPAVDLVHFTILRPPEKQDGTPIRELALIAFPSRELFEVKLGEFDLVIFDRYSRRGLLPLAYLDNVARYVEEGGALLEVAGPEFAHPLSLYRTPLSRVLPGRPSGVVYERGFVPSLTETGDRHPVTAGLLPADAPEADGEDTWGRWFRQIDVEVAGSQILMNGVNERPLLILERVGGGRVAQLLSDHAWLWARGFEDGGPQGLLLRRLVHWLMQEPELEEEALTVEPSGDQLLIERRSLDPEAGAVTVRTPEGEQLEVALEPVGDGRARATLEAPEAGLYEIADASNTTFAAVRPIGAEELADMRATSERLSPLVETGGGAVHWLADDDQPDLRTVAPDRVLAGRGWLGLQQNERYFVTGADQIPLLPALLALILLLLTLGGAWFREGR
ncbi:MAG: hypothetical protein R3349_01955 [Geminicoccaceae bacterium]|nr:hypothetical protein [Geminicoccaceae bacterium]